MIFSRKGFDSSSGGKASPIIDTHMLSIPIPEGWSGDGYDDLVFSLEGRSKPVSYGSVMRDLGIRQFSECHLDPDIRRDMKADRGQDWIPAFGQSAAQASELRDVREGDLFLFFGTFRHAKEESGKFKYVTPESQEFHALWGYLQVGNIYRWPEGKWGDLPTVNELPQALQYHPHWRTAWIRENKNILFTPSTTDVFGGNGCGTFKFNTDLVLTSSDRTNSLKSLWKPLDFLGFTNNRVKANTKETGGAHWNSGGRGQEFAFNVKEKAKLNAWLKKLVAH